jgi:two-component system response regulator
MNIRANGIKTLEILLVDDSPGDIILAQEALKQAEVKNSISIVYDGEEAMAFLRREGKYENAPRPDLILLDLNMPKKNGFEVLAELKTDENLKHIPVVVLTVSDSEEDILHCYNLYANCYVTKSVAFNDFVDVVNSMLNFWVRIVRLPFN